MSVLIDHDYFSPNINVSDYVKSLSDSDQQRYAEKLKVKCPNGTAVILDDPYLLDSSKWSEDLSIWPDVQYGNIYSYLIESPGDYTAACLKHYRSLDAYNYVLSGKVKKVLVYKHESLENFRILTAKVQPSQRTRNPDYQPWVLVHTDGAVETAHCNCIAGLGEACSHIAALLFKIERAVNFGYTKRAPTDEICRWNSSFKKKVSPSKISALDFSKPKWQTENERREKKKLSNEGMTDEEIEVLRSVQPNAVYFTLVDHTTTRNDETDASENQLVPSVPNIPRIIKETTQNSIEDMELFLRSYFTDENCCSLEIQTRGQAINELWLSQRRGRVTASRFGEIYKKKTFSQDFINSFIQPPNSINTPAIKWGRINEKTALKAYQNAMEKNHVNFKIVECGLFVWKEAPYLGASPDAVVSCACCGEGLVEIKCPYKHKNVSPQSAAATDSRFCLNPNLELKDTHNYFYQVQGQLLLTKKNFCDFTVWTPLGVIICRIFKNEEMAKKLYVKIKDFFFKWVLPALIKE